MSRIDIELVKKAQEIVRNVTLRNIEISIKKLGVLSSLAQEEKVKELLDQYPEALIANLTL